MPLYDHFHQPMKRKFPWTALHSAWATFLATNLVERWLPSPFTALEHTYMGTDIEIDVATYETALEGSAASGNGGTSAALPRTWAVPTPRATAALEFSDTYEVLVYADEDGLQLVGAIELVSPKNKDRPGRRRSFVRKCASLLQQGVSVVVLDVVTERRANLHNQLMNEMGITGPALLPPKTSIYVSSYRPVKRNEQTELDVWAEPCVLGEAVPTVPLRLTGDLIIPVEFEATYHEICQRRNLI
jgi:hypothetical protein